METMKKRHISLTNALATAQEAIALYREYVNNEKLSNSFRDSLIQRFEYSIDTFWKYLRHYLQDIKRLSVEPSPRDTFDAAKKISVLSTHEYAVLTEAIKERNKTSHIYHEEIADILAKNIPRYFEALLNITNRLTPE